MITMRADTTRLLRDAAAWRLIGLLFERPTQGWDVRVAALAADVDDAALRDAAAAAPAERSDGLHHSLFGPGGPVPPREVTYAGGVQFGYLMAELAAHYQAFAYERLPDEPDDHVSVEAGFVAYLLLKEAYARASGDEASADLAEDARGRFIAEHLALMGEPLARALDGGPTYLALAASALLERTGRAPRRLIPVDNGGGDEAEAETGCQTDGQPGTLKDQ